MVGRIRVSTGVLVKVRIWSTDGIGLQRVWIRVKVNRAMARERAGRK